MSQLLSIVSKPTRPSTDRFIGYLLGHALGDAMGAPFEGLSGETIWRDFGGPAKATAAHASEPLCYTDDTQMMIGVAETLVACGQIDPDYLMSRFVANYDPRRCYGQGMQRVLDAAARGEEWEPIVETLFPGGSYGNGAAMRVGPVGLRFCGDLDLAVKEAGISAAVTHRHPWGIDGARVYAAAVASVVSVDDLNSADFFSKLAAVAVTEEFQWQLKTAAKLQSGDTLTFGSSLPAHRSVVSALLCFTRSPRDFGQAVYSAIGMGDDTDTLAGMAGGLVGAYGGFNALPSEWLARLEDQGQGRSVIAQLGERLARDQS